jgi:hypothetical protein
MSAFGGKADITATERNFNLRLPQKLRQRCSPRSAAASSFVSSLAAVIAPAHPRNKYMQEVAHKEENHELVSPDSIYSRHSNSQLLDARFSGCRCYLDYLLIRRTLKRASCSSTDHGGGKRRSVTTYGKRKPAAVVGILRRAWSVRRMKATCPSTLV